MAFYAEIENYDEKGPKIFLVEDFQAAADIKRIGFSACDDVKAPTDKTTLTLKYDIKESYRKEVIVNASYQEVRDACQLCLRDGTIPNFKI